MGAFRTIIGCNMEQYETHSFDPTRYLVLDTQEPKTISTDSIIAQQPLQSGDTMSDHMYRNPDIVNISGMFSLNGKNWDDDSYNFIESGDRLTNIQEVFERIKNEGILCRITTIDEDDFAYNQSTGVINLKSNAKSRFKIRNNMALTSIQWTENQNTIKFTFKFVEVIMVEAQEYEPLSEEEREALGLPHVTSPVGSSLGTVLAETGQLQQVIIQSLYDNGYIMDDFLTALGGIAEEFFKDYAIAGAVISVGVAVGLISYGVGSALAAAGATMGTLFPVGTIVLAVGTVIAGIAIGISKFIEWCKKQQKQDIAFKLVNGSPETDGMRLKLLLDDIELKVNNVKNNLTVYTINGNYRQIVTINIAGEYYLITFDTNNATDDNEWGATVTNMKNEPLNSVYHSWCPVSSFTDLNRTANLWFRDNTKQYEAYLVNPSLSEKVSKNPEDLKAAKANLEGYTIWISKGNIQENVEAVMNAIEQAIEEEGFV